jgi:hypothetical protein
MEHQECQGGESNSRPRAYESPALPLSYPGAKNLFSRNAHAAQLLNNPKRVSVFFAFMMTTRAAFGTNVSTTQAFRFRLAGVTIPSRRI